MTAGSSAVPIGLAGVAAGAAVLVCAGARGRRFARAAPAGAPPAPRARLDLAGALHATAAQLRAGSEPAAAWEHVLGARPTSAAALERLLGERCGGVGRRRGTRAGSRSRSGSGGAAVATRARVRAAVAAVAVAGELGAPLAPVLERIAGAVALDEEAAADLDAALAGPRATARLLGWLPALGLVVGLALGADPVGVLLSGGLGSWVGGVGVALTVVGRVWTGRLVRAASEAGS